ncbi:MAG: tetratricopeptide repeat protein, partial [Proteobacteria bacterium]|nr:tetratricopeptide repeat protein [Pseudomonadota bacterium]
MIFAFSVSVFGADSPELDLSKGIVASLKGDWNQAVIEFEKVVKNTPNSETALSYLGQAYYQLGEDEKAVRIFQQLLSRFPNRSDFYLNLGLALLKLGKDESAQKEFQLAETVIPPNAMETYQRDFQERFKEKAKSWRARISSGTQYDSNIILAPLDSGLSSRISRQWGLRQIVLGSAEFTHSFMEKSRSGLSYSYYQAFNYKLNQDFDPTEFNLQDNTLGVFSTYEGSKSLLRFSYFYDLLLAGNPLGVPKALLHNLKHNQVLHE